MRVLLPLLAAAAAAAPTHAQQAREPQLVVTGTTGAPSGIALASENDDLSAFLFRDSGDNTIWLRSSDGRGLNWDAAQRLDDDASFAPKNTASHSLVVDGMRLYAAWLDERNGAFDDLYFTASLDGGATWSANNIRLDDGFGKSERDVHEFRIASSGNDVVALISVEDPTEKLYLTWSNDGGASWEDAIEVTSHNSTSDIDDIALAASADRAYIAWRDNFTNGVDDTVWFSSFDLKNGNFVLQDIDLSPNMAIAGGDADDGIEIAVDNSHVAVIFHADNLGSVSEQVRINLSSDLGTNWSGDQMVGQYDNAIAGHDTDDGTVLVEDARLAVSWRDNRSGVDQVYVTTADFAGMTFAPDHLCSDGTTGVGPPHMAGEFSGETLAIAWNQFDGRVAKACSFRNDVWGSSFLLSNNPGDVRNVRLAWNDLYDNFLATYVSNDVLDDEIFAGGFRNQQVAGSLTAGAAATLTVSGFEANVDFRVVAAAATGNVRIPDGRNIGLAFDSFLDKTRKIGLLRSTTDAFGKGSTAPIVVPSGLAGSQLYLLAVSFKNNGDIADLSDVLPVLVN
jgi:hypothetical protein